MYITLFVVFFISTGSRSVNVKTSSKMPSELWETICSSALLIFKDLCEDVNNRQISYQKIVELDKKISRVLELYKCLPKKMSPELPKGSTMESLITQRKKEYKSFQTLEEKLFHFIKYLKNVPVKGYLILIYSFVTYTVQLLDLSIKAKHCDCKLCE